MRNKLKFEEVWRHFASFLVTCPSENQQCIIKVKPLLALEGALERSRKAKDLTSLGAGEIIEKMYVHYPSGVSKEGFPRLVIKTDKRKYVFVTDIGISHKVAKIEEA